MKRIPVDERPDWRARATEYGFGFHTMYDEPYWCEDAYYQFTLAQVDYLEETIRCVCRWWKKWLTAKSC